MQPLQKPLVLLLLLSKFLNSDFQCSVFHQSLRAVTFHTCCFQFVWCLYLLLWICQDLITNWHLISFRWKWIPLRHLEKTHEVTSKSVTISPMFFPRTFGVLSSTWLAISWRFIMRNKLQRSILNNRPWICILQKINIIYYTWAMYTQCVLILCLGFYKVFYQSVWKSLIWSTLLHCL